jgi:hypothetical protein
MAKLTIVDPRYDLKRYYLSKYKTHQIQRNVILSTCIFLHTEYSILKVIILCT